MPIHFKRECLISHRSAQGMSQDVLAAESGLSLKTVQRAEKSGKASSRTIREISNVLGLEIADLKRSYVEGTEKKPAEGNDLVPRDSLGYVKASFSIRRASREALRRTSQRYGVKASTIVDLAPALFTLAAEISLARRAEALDQLRDGLIEVENSLSSLTRKAAHLRGFLGISEVLLDNAIMAEEESIKKHDLRCGSDAFADHWNEYEDDPFIATLNELASNIPDEVLGEFQDDVDDRISCRCCEGEQERQIRDEFKETPDWAQLVIDGDIPHEVAKEALEKEAPELVFKALAEHMTPAERQSVLDKLTRSEIAGGQNG